MSWRSAKTSWCVKCNADRPLVKRAGRHYCAICYDRVELPTKYKSKPTASKFSLGPGGKPRVFQSKREANREPVLVALQNSGQIRDLQYQAPTFSFRIYSSGPVDALLFVVTAILADSEWPLPEGVRDRLKRAFNDVQLSTVSVPGKYRPDFTYHDAAGELHVEDPKGAKTMQYRRSKALMLACFGIEVEEPGEGGVQQRARGCGIRGRGTGARLMGGR